jgi:hypothetical protein
MKYLLLLLLMMMLSIAVSPATAERRSRGSGRKDVHVHDYYRKNGTYVHSHDRAAPGMGSHSSSVAFAAPLDRRLRRSIQQMNPRSKLSGNPLLPFGNQY